MSTVSQVSRASNSFEMQTQTHKGKFQRFSDWCREHKKAIAVTILIIGIASLTFGAGSFLATFPIANFSLLRLGLFVGSLFTYTPHYWGLAISGLSSTGILFFTGVASIFFGMGMIGYGAGMLSGLPSKDSIKSNQDPVLPKQDPVLSNQNLSCRIKNRFSKIFNHVF